MNKQQKRNQVVMERLVDMSRDEDDAYEIAKALEVMLDDLASNDFFGTEGHLDPRGDKRGEEENKEFYTMFNVEGVDV